MASPLPLFANERNAARLLDMRPGEFRKLVNDGLLPNPRDIAGRERWDVEELRRIGSGEAAEGMGDVSW